jgi:hypothetical protein
MRSLAYGGSAQRLGLTELSKLYCGGKCHRGHEPQAHFLPQRLGLPFSPGLLLPAQGWPRYRVIAAARALIRLTRIALCNLAAEVTLLQRHGPPFGS